MNLNAAIDATGPHTRLSLLATAIRLMRYERTAAHRAKLLAGFWNLLEPLMTIAAYWFLLVKIFGVRSEGFIFFLFLSVSLHRFGMASLNRGASVMIRYEALVKSGLLPSKAAVIVVSVINGLVDLAVALAVFVTAWIGFGGGSLSVTWFAVLPLLVVYAVFSFGTMLLLSCIGVYWRDLTSAMSILSRILFFACPVLYTIDRIPVDYRGIYMLNPFASFYELFRQVLLHNRWPDSGYFLYVTVITAVVCLAGWFVFSRLEGRIGKYW